MKCVFVGNLATRTELKDAKKKKAKKGKRKRAKAELSGASYYSAITAARLGHDTTLITKLSSAFDPKWIHRIEKEKIKLIRLPAWQDTAYEVSYDKEGNKVIKVVSDAGPIVAVPKLACDVVQISSYFGHIGLGVLRTLKQQNEETQLSLDAQSFIKYRNPDGVISFAPWLEKEAYLRYADILKVNATELYYLTGKATLHSAQDLLKLGPKVVALTLREKGAWLFHEKRGRRIPVYETKVVDYKGVGDVFLAALSIRFRETEDILDAGYFASAAASFCVEKEGLKGLVSKSRVEKRYKVLREIFLA